MEDSFDLSEYIRFLQSRWKFAAIACSSAILAAAIISLLLPKRYTATATVLIDPPAGADPRTATAVSTVYLESLKTYELLAADDQLFMRAVEKLHVRDDDSSPLESLKRRVLKVDKIRDTRALQISVTLNDPQRAQAMAQFIAEGAVQLSRSGGRQAVEAMIDDAASAAEAAKARLDQAEAAWTKAAAGFSEEALRSEMLADSDLQSRAEEQVMDERAFQSEPRVQDSQSVEISRARIAALERQISELDRKIRQNSAELADQGAREDNLHATLGSARSEYETAAERLSELRLSAGSRNEWLRVVDPGIIPQRASSPNVPAIFIGAEVLALFGSLLYLTSAFIAGHEKPLFYGSASLAAHGDD